MRTDFPVSAGPKPTTPVWRAHEWLQRVPRWPWRTLRWRRGTTGWLRQKFVAVWCWRITSDGERHEGWVVGERATRGQPEELAGRARRRHAIAPFHEEATGEMGWDQYQGFLWPGFYRHAVTVMLAYSFLVWLERRQRHSPTRQGRRGDPVPPSPPSRRQSLPAVHREVARWLRHQAVPRWVTTDRFIELCSYRI
jgi:hypothetical protein